MLIWFMPESEKPVWRLSKAMRVPLLAASMKVAAKNTGAVAFALRSIWATTWRQHSFHHGTAET